VYGELARVIVQRLFLLISGGLRRNFIGMAARPGGGRGAIVGARRDRRGKGRMQPSRVC